MSLTKPNIDVVFKKLATSFVSRSSSMNVILIVRDDTDQTFSKKVYTSESDVIADKEKYSTDNYQAIRDCFVSNIKQCTVIRIDSDGEITDAFKIAKGLATGYVGVYSETQADHDALVTWIKEQEASKKSFKGIVYNPATPPDSREVLAFYNENVTFSDESRGEKVGYEYIPSLLGYIAGRPTSEGVTYLVMSNLSSVAEPEDFDAAIDAGQLVLFNDESKVRILLGINSKTTIGEDETEDMRLIEVSEAMDMIRDDITNTYKNYYIGKYKNTNDNREIFVSAVNDYFLELEQSEILNSDYDNIAYQDIDSMRAYLQEQGVDTVDMEDTDIKKQKFGTNVFIKSDIEIAEAMTNLTFTNQMN